MGIPWDEDEIGNDCSQFPAGTTPKYLWASLSGIYACWDLPFLPGPTNGIYKLTQDPTIPCMWLYLDDDVMVSFQLAAGVSALSAGYYYSGWPTFDSVVGSSRVFSFASTLACTIYPMMPWFAGGTGIVSRRHRGTAPAVANVAKLLNIEQEPESMADFYPAAGGKAMLKFCRQKTPTNILIKVDYSAFES